MSYLSTSSYSSRKGVKGQNNTNGLDLEDEVADDLNGHGICIGITGSWIIGLLSGNPAATDTGEFEAYMKTFLRYQGAYIKFAHHISNGERITSLMGSMGLAALASKSEHIDVVSLLNFFPAEDVTWAAHLSIYHHAVGCGHLAGSGYYIMDPNHGLYTYDSYAKMQTVLDAYRAARKVKAAGTDRTCNAWIYRKN